MSLKDFLSRLEVTPWFSRLGTQADADPSGSMTSWMATWDDWPGPEVHRVIELHTRQQAIFDSLFVRFPDRTKEMQELWDQIHEIVFAAATQAVPFDPTEDSWHGPTMAVWQAAWTAGLVGLHFLLNLSLPREIEEQWSWFERGHWPAGFARIGDGAEPQSYLVY